MSPHPTTFASGFTLIEIVCVLVLLGILSAVALPKYFDLQAEAQEKACAQNRSVVLSSLNGEFATMALNGDSLATIDQSWADGKIAAMEASGQKLCPGEGIISARPNFGTETYSFDVWCSVHHPDTGGSANSDVSTNNKNISATNAKLFLDWLLDVFKQPTDVPVETPWGTGEKADLATFFYRNGIDTEVDSDATMSTTYMASFVEKALQADGIDTSSIIWKLSKEDWRKGANSGTLVVTVADRSDVTEENVGKAINATQYRVKVTYQADGTLVFGKPETNETASVTLGMNTAKNYYKLLP